VGDRARYLGLAVELASLHVTVRERRLARGVTQTALAARLGVNRSTLWWFERGEIDLRPRHQVELLRWLSETSLT
jgi:transcriptional regulator with XRE-family HTH domain